MANAVVAPERIDHGVDHRRAGADGAGLARAFDAERIILAGHIAGFELERWRVRGARQRVCLLYTSDAADE